ncbi:TPA: SNAP receptor use1 [Trebouxia sp. C0005]
MALKLQGLPSSDLPAPKSGSYSELSFRRLLKSCDEIAAGDTKGREELQDWQHSPVFYQYVSSLEGHLVDLENRISKRVQPETMAQYHAHVNRLKEAINEPAQASFASEATNAGSTDASEVIANVEAQLVGEAASHAAAAPAETQRPPAAMFNPPVPNSTRIDESGAAEANSSQGLRQRGQRQPEAPLSQAAQAKLKMHGNLQENVSDDMVGLSSQLLANVRAMQGAVQTREGLLSEAETAQDASLVNADYAVKTSKNIKNRGKVGLCVKLAILIAVGCIVPAMYIFIRSTYFLGYKRR